MRKTKQRPSRSLSGALLCSCLLALSSCDKDKKVETGGPDPSPYYLKAKINGQQRSFGTDMTATSDAQSLSISGATSSNTQDKAVLRISITNNPTAIGTQTYQLSSGSYLLYGGYTTKQVTGTANILETRTWAATDTTLDVSDSFNVVVTAIDPQHVEGSFEGRLMLPVSHATQPVVTVTDGQFSLPLQ